jgi:hypothetical protein
MMDEYRDCCATPLNAIFSRMAALTKTLAVIAGILIVFAGVVLCRVQYNKAEDPIEATYWYIRYWGFVSGAYASALFISAFIHNCSGETLFGLLDYWPAVSMVWTEDSWFGERSHIDALMYDALLLGLLAFPLTSSPP